MRHGTEELEEDACEGDDGDDGAEAEALAREQHAELVDDQTDDIREPGHIPKRDPRPLGIAHLAPNGADGGEARRAQQVERAERHDRGG